MSRPPHPVPRTSHAPASLPPAMGPFGQLLLVVGAMSVGTFVFGSLPLVLPLGRAKLRYVELVGSGLLLGAAFTVVIPEGVATVIRAADTLRRLSGAIPDSRFWRFFTDGETVIGTMLLLGFFLMFVYVQMCPCSSPLRAFKPERLAS